MVELAPQHLVAELAVAATEQQVLVPDLVDHPRRRDREVRHQPQVEELLVLADGPHRERAAPMELARQLVANACVYVSEPSNVARSASMRCGGTRWSK
jgi:hypothetical protein